MERSVSISNNEVFSTPNPLKELRTNKIDKNGLVDSFITKMLGMDLYYVQFKFLILFMIIFFTISVYPNL